MREALDLVDLNSNDAPVAALIVDLNNNVVTKATNNTSIDPSGHAEVLAIREASLKMGSSKLINCSIYVTLEPCAMCAALISYSRIKNLYYGARDPKFGAIESNINFYQDFAYLHKPHVYAGIMEEECTNLLRNHFLSRRI